MRRFHSFSIHIHSTRARGFHNPRARVLLCGLALAILLPGCGQSTRQTAQSPQPPTAKQDKTSSTNWAKTLETWWGKWNQDAKLPASAPSADPPLPLVTINLNALAARHPAWKLAQSLEASEESSLDFKEIRAAGFSTPQLAAPSFDVGFDRADTQNPASEGDTETFRAPTQIEGYEREAEAVATVNLKEFNRRAASEQIDALEFFVRQAEAAQTLARDDYEGLQRTAIKSEVEALREAALPDLEPILLSPEDQLKVINLRLQLELLRGDVVPDKDKIKQAEDELNAILAAWHARLREQSLARRAEIDRAKNELPRALREQREVELRRELSEIVRAQSRLRQFVLRAHRERVEQDFGDENARLGIILPAAVLSAQAWGRPSSEDGASPPPSLPDLIETNFSVLSSPGGMGSGFNAPALSERTLAPNAGFQSRSAMIRALKTQALRDARKQAQSAARRFGWRWQPAPGQTSTAIRATAPDRTAQVLNWLDS